MKKLKLIILSFAFIALGMMVSCNEADTNENDNSDTIEKTGDTENNTEENIETEEVKNGEEANQTFKYVCPAGCEEGKSDKPGNCPSCDMELIENVD